MRSTQLTDVTLARWKRQLHVLGVRHEDVAVEAAKTSRRGTVGRSMVSKFLAGDAKSENLRRVVPRMIREARAGSHRVERTGAESLVTIAAP